MASGEERNVLVKSAIAASDTAAMTTSFFLFMSDLGVAEGPYYQISRTPTKGGASPSTQISDSGVGAILVARGVLIITRKISRPASGIFRESDTHPENGQKSYPGAYSLAPPSRFVPAWQLWAGRFGHSFTVLPPRHGPPWHQLA